MTMNRLAAIFLVVATQAALADERWIILGYKAQGKFSLDLASIVKNENVRMNGDIKEAHVKIEWSGTTGGYDQLDSTLLFDCENQFFGIGEDKFRLKGALIKHLIYHDFQLHKISAEVTINAWETVCGKLFDRTDPAPLQPSSRENTI